MRPVAGGLGAHAAALIRVEAEVPHKMRPGVGDVLGELQTGTSPSIVPMLRQPRTA
jgi:hypothetical protein